jgi:hypothetical protein
MRFKRTATAVAAIAALAGGCSSPERPHSAPIIFATTVPVPDLTFNRHPGVNDNMRASTCNTDPNNWVRDTDNRPQEAEEAGGPTTLGLAERWDEDGNPIFAAGATIAKLGDYTYRIATSDDTPGESEVINILSHPYARVLRGEAGRYDVVLSGRLSGDGKVYFEGNCLPNFDFHGNRTSVPPPDLPALPQDPTTTIPTPTTRFTV